MPPLFLIKDLPIDNYNLEQSMREWWSLIPADCSADDPHNPLITPIRRRDFFRVNVYFEIYQEFQSYFPFFLTFFPSLAGSYVLPNSRRFLAVQLKPGFSL